jgi:SPP1 family predicted phage head-tail adaptor
MRRRVTLLRLERTGGTFPTETWEPWKTVWGEYRELSGREYLEAGKTAAEVTGKIYLRYLDGVSSEMRATIDDELTVEIVAALSPDGKRRELLLMVKKVS